MQNKTLIQIINDLNAKAEKLGYNNFAEKLYASGFITGNYDEIASYIENLFLEQFKTDNLSVRKLRKDYIKFRIWCTKNKIELKRINDFQPESKHDPFELFYIIIGLIALSGGVIWKYIGYSKDGINWRFQYFFIDGNLIIILGSLVIISSIYGFYKRRQINKYLNKN